MKKLLFHLALLICVNSFAQKSASLPVGNDVLFKEIERIKGDAKITADSAFSLLADYNQYPEVKSINRYHLFIYKDSTFGMVPLNIFVPKNYKRDVPSPAVLLLHGAVVLSSFKDAYKDTTSDEDFFYDYFAKRNYIIIRPFADSRGPNTDGTKLFDWVINFFNGRGSRNRTNPTFQTLTSIICRLKQSLNIDDNKVFVFGHSDGADGAFALQVYKPSSFAGFMVYNSMLVNIFAHDIYLRNTLNRPLYLVHSDLDDLRPIQQTRPIVDILDSLKSPTLYKEYIGFKHFDKHLQLDMPLSYAWTHQISRNPFQKSITWELSDTSNNNCDWLRVVRFDTTASGAAWHTKLNTSLYNKRDKVFMDTHLYYDLNKSAAISAYYNNNTFEICSSRITEIELLISPVMVNILEPVVVNVNGKEVYREKVTANKSFLLKNFEVSFDRKALWVTSIKLNTD
jgi:predicted esterase